MPGLPLAEKDAPSPVPLRRTPETHPKEVPRPATFRRAAGPSGFAKAGVSAAGKTPHGISQAQMADRLGMHRTSLLRALRELRKRGVIHTLNERPLVIADMEELRRLAENGQA